MHDPSISPDDPQFLARAFANELRPDEAAALRRWLAGDPSRRWEFEQLRRAWSDAGRVRQAWDAESALAAIKAQAANEAASGRATAERASVHRAPFSHRPPAGRGLLRSAVWATAAAAMIAVGMREYLSRPATAPAVLPAPAQFREVSTGRGETAQLRFADGTEIRLAPTSRLRYPANMLGPSRELDLDGEAYVVVGHHPEARAPFLVRTTLGTTRDIGTSFLVRALPKSALEVVVVEGLVSLHLAATAADRAAPSDSLLIPPGSLGAITASGTLRAPRRVRVDAYTSWLDGRMTFVDTPLREVLSTLARWRALESTIADAAIAGRRFTGSFTRETTAEILDVIAMTSHLRIDHRGDMVIVRDDPTRATSPRATDQR